MVYLAVEASRVWAGSDQELLSASASFPPVWRMLLFGDGSPTRTLQMLSGYMRAYVLLRPLLPRTFTLECASVCSSRTTVDVTSMKVCEDGEPMLPLALEVPGPLLCRQVWLTNERGERLGYAASWWNVEEVNIHSACLTDLRACVISSGGHLPR